MNNMHNLGTVIKFEITRMLKKPTFWLMALGFPVLIAGVFGIVFWSNQATMDAAERLAEEEFSVMITDASGLINSELAAEFGAERAESREAGIQAVRSGDIDAYFYYPSNIATEDIEVYGEDVGLFNNSRYGAVAGALLGQSIAEGVDPTVLLVLTDEVTTSTTMYRDGEVYDGLREMIVPGFFLILFYLLIGFFGNQMLNSTIEEKENRTIEMLLTAIQPTALISGKIISLILLAFIQSAVIIVPILLLYFLAGAQLDMPNFELGSLPIDPVRVGLNAVIFMFSFLMFTGLLVAVGAAMPTAKEASQWFGFIIILIFGPLYGVTAFISHPESPFVQFLSLFPLTSPIPLMLRTAYGNIPLGEALLGIAILAVSSVVIMLLAVRIFRYGAMQYDSKLSLKALRVKRAK